MDAAEKAAVHLLVKLVGLLSTAVEQEALVALVVTALRERGAVRYSAQAAEPVAEVMVQAVGDRLVVLGVVMQQVEEG